MPTNRGSMGNMQEYVAFLNEAAKRKGLDLAIVEAWWVQRVRDYFESSPIKLKVDTGSSIKACLTAIFDEAKRRHTFIDLVARYNAIIDACETDPSLKIEVA